MTHEHVSPMVDIHHACLDPAVKLEPLVDRWYTWPHLLCPAQQAMNLAFRYLPTVRSFISAPSVHVAASRDPLMYGGPFVDLPADAVKEARDYLSSIETSRASAIALAHCLREFSKTLQAATGYSLEEQREQTPPDLAGLVELVYDLSNHAKIRILEEVLDVSDLGNVDAEEVLLHRQLDVDRPFFLSTPRLRMDGGLFIKAPFRSEGVKALYAARRTPTNLEKLAPILHKNVEDISPFFTSPENIQHASAYKGSGVRVRYFGHACVVVETDTLAMVIDPTAASDKLEGIEHFTFADFPPRIDYLIISHGHQDHLCPEILMQLRDRVDVVVVPPSNRGDLADPSLTRMLAHLGFENIKVLDSLQNLSIPGGHILSLPFTGEHCDLDVHSKQCILLEVKGRKVCFLIDTDAVDIAVYKRLHNRLTSPDLMLIGMECSGAPLTWLYGPLLPVQISKRNDESRRLSGATFARAWALTELLAPKRVLIYAMGQEPWMKSLMGLQYSADSIQLKESDALIESCLTAGIPAERLYQHFEAII